MTSLLDRRFLPVYFLLGLIEICFDHFFYFWPRVFNQTFMSRMLTTKFARSDWKLLFYTKILIFNKWASFDAEFFSDLNSNHSKKVYKTFHCAINTYRVIVAPILCLLSLVAWQLLRAPSNHALILLTLKMASSNKNQLTPAGNKPSRKPSFTPSPWPKFCFESECFKSKLKTF